MATFQELNPPLNAKERVRYIETLRSSFSIMRQQNNARGPDVEASAVDFARMMLEAYDELDDQNKLTLRLYCWPIVCDESGHQSFLTIKDISKKMNISERTGERWISKAIEAHRETFANQLVNGGFQKINII